ncbi:MAG: hypothetical protein WBA77_21655 [Microcoleaceae cyanobacterium]
MAQDKTQNLFTEMTTEESSTVNGGHGYYGGYSRGYGYRKSSYGYGYGRNYYGYGYGRSSDYSPRYYNTSYYGGYSCY